MTIPKYSETPLPETPQSLPHTASAVVPAGKPTIWQCGGITKTGASCKRRVKGPGKTCWDHPTVSDATVTMKYSKPSPPETPQSLPHTASSLVPAGKPTIWQCGGVTNTGAPCKRRVKGPGKTCWDHPTVSNAMTMKYSKTSPPETPKSLPRTAESALVPAGKPTIQPCSGITKTGAPCKRWVKAPEKTCRDHPTEFHSLKPGGQMIPYSDWIHPELSSKTQVKMRQHMTNAPTSEDGLGYIYVIKILPFNASGTITFKIGSTMNQIPKTRVKASFRELGRKVERMVWLGCWPGTVIQDDNNSRLDKGEPVPGAAAPFCRRWEKLVLLELTDLAVHTWHLEGEFSNLENLVHQFKAAKRNHSEIITFKLSKKGKYQSSKSIFEEIVKIVAKWRGFVKLAY